MTRLIVALFVIVLLLALAGAIQQCSETARQESAAAVMSGAGTG